MSVRMPRNNAEARGWGWREILPRYAFEEIFCAVENKRAIVVPNSTAFRRPIPAAFLVNLPFVIVDRLVGLGMFLYRKGGKDGKR